MFTISESQLSELADRRWANLIDEVARWLVSEYPDEPGIDFADIRPQVQNCARPLREWGISDGDLVRSHIYACKALGIDYLDVAPMVGKVLSDSSLSDATKRAWMSGWIQAVQERMLTEAA